MLLEIQLTVPGFDGALQALVESVRRHEINILDVKLAPVARQVAFSMLESNSLDFSPCTAVAGLMFVKSRNLLPWQEPLEEPELDEFATPVEEEEEPTQVRERLLALYEIFRQAAEELRYRSERMQMRIRPGQTRPHASPGFLDEITFVDEITAYDLLLVMNKALKRAEEQQRIYKVDVDDTYILNKRIAEVFSYIYERTGEDTRFSQIISGGAQKREAVITFLAIIYLVSQGKIVARQKIPYGEILMTVRPADGAVEEL